MDIQSLTATVRSFRFTDSEKAKHGYKRILIQLFGFLGHGKSSFINSCRYVMDGGDYVNLAGADSSDAGRTTARISYKLTEDIILVDNRGCSTMNSHETGEIFAQLANLLPLDQEVEWSTGFRLVDRIVDAETEIQKSDFIFPVFLYSVKKGIYESDIEDLKQLLDTAKMLTGIFPFIVLTHKTHGGMSRIERQFQDMGAERVFALENYTPEDHFKTRGRHEDVLKFFHEIIKEAQFKVEQVWDPAQGFKERKQFVLKFIYEREMKSYRGQREQKTQAEQTYLVKRLESLKFRSEVQRQEDKRYYDAEMKKIQEQFEDLRRSDALRFETEMKEYQRKLEKAKKNDCNLQ
ncbi:uncharacterized protein LOC120942561 [Rana temporaria]|uniref:uncharacterized protein LOC120942561 n=1 Tax=Rana temporaria TaxID=8407 RepID=UPI001AAD0B87|nr:uncharacterized protein LOC120942561 [Rana temporaria]